MAKCRSPHPEDPTRLCILPPSGHASHTDRDGPPWEDPDRVREVARTRPRSKKDLTSTAAEWIAGTRPERHVVDGFTKASGMTATQTSEASADFRTLFQNAVRRVALTHPEFSSNEVWDLLKAEGYRKTGSHQAAGPTMSSWAVKQGLCVPTDRTVENTSGWGHSTDNGVRVYRSLVCQSA